MVLKSRYNALEQSGLSDAEVTRVSEFSDYVMDLVSCLVAGVIAKHASRVFRAIASGDQPEFEDLRRGTIALNDVIAELEEEYSCLLVTACSKNTNALEKASQIVNNLLIFFKRLFHVLADLL